MSYLLIIIFNKNKNNTRLKIAFEIHFPMFLMYTISFSYMKSLKTILSRKNITKKVDK